MTTNQVDPGENGSAAGLEPPPSYGVSRPSGKILLPIPTSMEAILQDDGYGEAGLGSSGDLDGDPSYRAVSPRRIYIPAVIALSLLLAAAFVFWPDDGPPPVAPRGVEHATATPPGEPAPEPIAERPATDLAPRLARANDPQRMADMPYADRQELLASLEDQGATHGVDLDLHIGLNLIQASDSDRPCETFSQALTLIESSPERARFATALQRAAVPRPQPGEGQDACEGLQDRLDALLRPRATERATKPARPPRPARRTKAARPQPVEPEVSRATEPALERDEARPSIATVLDDGLRPLGSLSEDREH